MLRSHNSLFLKRFKIRPSAQFFRENIIYISMILKHNPLLFSLLTIVVISFSCTGDNIPRPRGLIRIDVPTYSYKTFNSDKFPFTFDYAEIAEVEVKDDSVNTWLNINYPKFKGTIYFTYLKMDSALAYYIEKSHDLAFKHITKANDIKTEFLSYPENKVHGLYFTIEGNDAASPINFLITDSIANFARGSLYFSFAPSNDSLQPVIKAVDTDIRKMLSSFKWKN